MIVTVLLAAGGPAGPWTPAAQERIATELTRVESVRFEKRQHVPSKALRSVLKTRGRSIWPWREAPLLRWDFLRADTAAIENVCRQYGFLEARAHVKLTPARRPGHEIVTFVLDEGGRTRIGTVGIGGLTVIPEATLRRKLYSRPGRTFNPLYLAADTAIIAREVRERARLPRVSGEAVLDSLVADVRYEVEEGPPYRFGTVHLSSPDRLRVKSRLVLREMAFREGDPLKASKITESIEEVYQTDLFSQVQMVPLPDSSNRTVEFDLRVRERPRRWTDLGIGSGTSERLRATAEWGHRNLNARGLRTTVSSRLALDGDAKFLLARGQLSFYDPWLLGTRRRSSATVYYEARHDRADPRWVVKQDSRGVGFQVRREYGRIARLTLTQDNAYVDQRLSFNASELTDAIRDSLARNVTPSYSTHRVGLAFTRDSRDDLLNPTRGTAQLLSAEVAGGPLRGTSSFTKGQALFKWTLPVRRAWVFAAQVHGGVMEPYGRASDFSPEGIDAEVARVPLEDRFRSGGVNSIRGYNENALNPSGGLAMLQANAELRVPLVGPFGAELFVDAGNVWARPEYMRWGDFTPRLSDAAYGESDVRYVCGVGARLNLPFGPLRFDVSWSARPEVAGRDRRPRTQFALGPAF